MAQSFQDDMEISFDPGGQPFETKATLAPPDKEVRLTVVDSRLNRPFKNADGEWRQTLNLIFSIDDDEIREELNLDDPRGSHTVWLEIDPKWDGEGPPPLVHGKPNQNLSFGKALEAFGLNDGQHPIKLPSMFMHEQCWGRTGRSTNDEDRYTPIVALGKSETAVSRRRR